MLAKPIWAPGEETDYGVLVADLLDEESSRVVPVKGEKMSVPKRGGGFRSATAVRGRYTRVEETASGKRYAVVKFDKVNGMVRVLVLGDWHLAGEKGPPVDVPATA